MGLATRSGGNCNAKLRVVRDLSLVHYQTAILSMVVVVVVVGLSNIGAVDGAKAMYVFGDSFDDTGNNPRTVSPTPWNYPYGITWPGNGTGRWSDGYNQADTFAQLFGLPSPIAYQLLMDNLSTPHEAGVNFAVGGAGVTAAAFGPPPFYTQVDQMEALVEKGVVIKHNLSESVALINFGVNDYDSRNIAAPSFRTSVDFGMQELEITVASITNLIVANIVRLYGLGLRNFIVTNLPLLVCTPLSEQEGMYKSCSTNSTLLNETSLHTSLLQKGVRLLNGQLPGVHVVIADQTKAFDQLFRNGSDYGFVDPLTPCCYGNNTTADLYAVLPCGMTDSAGNPVYHLCKDPSKAVLWDTIHPTQAAWKAVVRLFADVPGYTLEGPMLSTWITEYNV